MRKLAKRIIMKYYQQKIALGLPFTKGVFVSDWKKN